MTSAPTRSGKSASSDPAVSSSWTSGSGSRATPWPATASSRSVMISLLAKRGSIRIRPPRRRGHADSGNSPRSKPTRQACPFSSVTRPGRPARSRYDGAATATRRVVASFRAINPGASSLDARMATSNPPAARSTCRVDASSSTRTSG
ncbi:MAG: hypothetical protein MUF64_31565, partial [Polyangiaceae bacterium]|nr:hypothetical protein [Polyangiaceae bacterium]